MKKLASLLPFLLILNLTVCLAEDVDYSQETSYLNAKKVILSLNLKKADSGKFRKALSGLYYFDNYAFGNMKLSKAGRYNEEVLIEISNINLQVPEWCLMVFLNELENQPEYQDLHFKPMKLIADNQIVKEKNG